MTEAPPRPADLPDDPATLKALVRVLAFEIERLKEELRLAAHKRSAPAPRKPILIKGSCSTRPRL